MKYKRGHSQIFFPMSVCFLLQKYLTKKTIGINKKKKNQYNQSGCNLLFAKYEMKERKKMKNAVFFCLPRSKNKKCIWIVALHR